LPCKRRSDLENQSVELLWLEVKLVPKSILVGVCYRPPGMNREQASKFIDDLQISLNAAMMYESDGVYLLGDFNDRCKQWTAPHPESELKENLVDLTSAFGLHQLINEPTYITSTSSNTLDLIFTDSPGYVIESGTLPPIGTSKHAVVYCRSTKTRLCDKPYKKEIWKYHESDVEGLNVAIGEFPFEDVLSDYTDINHIAELWTQLVIAIAEDYIPHHNIKINPRDKPWITKDIKTTIKTRNRLYKRYLTTKKNEHLDVYNRVKQEVNTKIQAAKQNHKQNLIRKLENRNNAPKTFWNVMKKVYGNKIKGSIPTLLHEGQQYCTAEQKANLLAEYFASQSQAPNVTPEHTLPILEEHHYLDQIYITENEVISVLSKLHTEKAVGPDGISNKFLKMASHSLAPSMTSLFNKVIQKSTFPDIWKEANVSPVHKKGSRQNIRNYRPISLLSCVGKVLEKIIFNKIYAMCENRGLLTWRNSGYKKKDSTVNQLIYIVDSIYKSLDKKEECSIVFLDQSKAFDRIYHRGLKLKMKSFGINGPLYDLMCSYLDKRKIRVTLNGSKSKWHKVTAGVPQGSILGPLLFLIYIDDIVNNLESDIYLYADDAVLMSSFTKDDTTINFEQMNRDLERLSNWASKWFMQFNPAKTKFMVISNNQQTQYPTLSLNGADLEKVHTYPQIGLHLNDRMNWEDHINMLINKASKKIGMIWKLSGDIPRSAVENIYTAYIRPQLEYGSIIYHNCTEAQSNRLESVQRKAAVACTRAYNRTPTHALLDELGWETLKNRRKYNALVQLYKMNNGHSPVYLQSLLPPNPGNQGRYPNRRNKDFTIPRVNTTKYQKSFLPATVKMWNNLEENVKTITTIASFKSALKKQLFRKKCKYYSQGMGKWATTHTRMRLGLSPLKQHLHSFHIVPSPLCEQTCCHHHPESSMHYFLECQQYAASRAELLEVLGPTVDKLGIDKSDKKELNTFLLRGHQSLTQSENNELFQHVQKYIKDTNRF
jgi:hypothetical protein